MCRWLESNEDEIQMMSDTLSMESSSFREKFESLDVEWLSDRCNGDSSLVSEVCRHFSDQCRCHMSAMQNAWKDGRISEAAFHAEFLAGAAANVGATDLRLQAELLYDDLSDEMDDGRANSIPIKINSASVCFQRCLADVAAIRAECKRQKAPDTSRHVSAEQRKSCSFAWCMSSERLQGLQVEKVRRNSTSTVFFRKRRSGNRAHPSSAFVDTLPIQARDAAAFRRMRRHLDAMRAHNQAGRTLSARAEAFALSFAASGAGLWGLAGAAARAGIGGRYVSKQVMDALEVRLDTMAALWQLQR